MDHLSSFAVDPVTSELALLNLMVAIFLICKGLDYVGRTLLRRDPPKKAIRSKLAQADES